MIDRNKNLIQYEELCLKYDGYWQTWNRVLHMQRDGAQMVELNLTPINPQMRKNWVDQVFPLTIRAHRTALRPGSDRLYRFVQKNKQSLVYQELKEVLLANVPIELCHRLLNEDFISEIDWARYVEAQLSSTYRGGGVPFALCKRESLLE